MKTRKKLMFAAVGVIALTVGAYFYATTSNLKGDYYNSVRTNPRYTAQCLPAVAFQIEHLQENTDFTDIKNSPYEDEITFMGNEGLVEGQDYQMFAPNAPLNRAEFLKMALVAFGRSYDVEAKTDEFSDVRSNDWFNPYVKAGIDLDIVNGYPHEVFKPDNQVTYAEALKIALRATNCDFFEEGLKENGVYAQEFAKDWYKGYLQMADDIGVWDASYDHEMTRGEGAKLIYDIMKYSLGTMSIDMRVFQY